MLGYSRHSAAVAAAIGGFVALALAGCAASAPTVVVSVAQPRVSGLEPPRVLEKVRASCVIPTGWREAPPESGMFYHQRVWVSPTGRTAYGVTFIDLPFTFSEDFVLDAFLNDMRMREGDARLIERHQDATLPGLRAIAEGGRYRINLNLIFQGPKVWAVYAGTLRKFAVLRNELNLAELAREQTRVNVVASSTRAGLTGGGDCKRIAGAR